MDDRRTVHVMAIFVFLLVLAVLAPLFGTDSRDGRDWQPGQWEPGRFHV